MANLMLEHNAVRDTFVVADHPPYPVYRVWSERDRRWVVMTFNTYQAWLTRPDLDPTEFASGQLAS